MLLAFQVNKDTGKLVKARVVLEIAVYLMSWKGYSIKTPLPFLGIKAGTYITLHILRGAVSNALWKPNSVV